MNAACRAISMPWVRVIDLRRFAGISRTDPVTPSRTAPESRPTGFLLGEAGKSGRDTILCLQGIRLQAVKWRQWKAHLFQQDAFASTWLPYSIPHIHNLGWDPREEHEIDFPHASVLHPMASTVGAFLQTFAAEPPVKPGAPDPDTPPGPVSSAPRSTSGSASHRNAA